MKYTFLLFLAFLTSELFAQTGHHIQVSVDNYDNEFVIFAYRRGEQFPIQDTIYLQNGKGEIKGEEALPTGMYLLLFQPENKWFEFLVGPNDQQFSIATSGPNFGESLSITGSKENAAFDQYKAFMGDMVAQSKTLQEEIKNAPAEQVTKLNEQLQGMGNEVYAYQTKFVQEHTDLFAGKLVSSFQEIKVPEPPVRADGSIDSTFRYRYYRDHYFDGWDFQEAGFVRTPYLRQKLDYFSDKLLIQDPDSIFAAIDPLVQRTVGNEDMFRNVLSYFVDKYYKPKIVGQDRVFVYLSDKYISTGMVDWIDEKTKKTFLEDAYMMKNVMIGNPAPDVQVQRFDHATKTWTEELISPYDIDAEFTVVFLWKPGCSACQKMSEELVPFYEKLRTRGVEIFSISSANFKELDKATADVEKKNMSWIVTADPKLKARALVKYYGNTLPKLYLLDKDKNILFSRIGVEQLEDILVERMGEE